MHDRLERIESAVHRLTTAVERVAAQDPASLTVAQTTSASPPPSGHSLARGVDETPTLQRSSQTKPGAFIADKHGELHFLGANSLPSITSEAESVAQQRIRLKLPTLSGRSRTEASNVLRRLSGLKVDASSVVPDYEWEGINVNAGRWWFPDRDVAIHISHGLFFPRRRAGSLFPPSKLTARQNTSTAPMPSIPSSGESRTCRDCMVRTIIPTTRWTLHG